MQPDGLIAETLQPSGSYATLPPRKVTRFRIDGWEEDWDWTES